MFRHKGIEGALLDLACSRDMFTTRQKEFHQIYPYPDYQLSGIVSFMDKSMQILAGL